MTDRYIDLIEKLTTDHPSTMIAIDALDSTCRAFILEYLTFPDAARAAVSAGVHPIQSMREGKRLLHCKPVQEVLRLYYEGEMIKKEVTVQDVLSEYIILAKSDIGDFMTWSNDEVRLRDMAEIDPVKRRAISTIKLAANGTFEVKLHDKKGSLDALAKILGMFNDKDKELAETNERLNQLLSLIQTGDSVLSDQQANRKVQ